MKYHFCKIKNIIKNKKYLTYGAFAHKIVVMETVRKKVLDAQRMARARKCMENQIVNLGKRRPVSEESLVISRMTNWQKAKMMKFCHGKIFSLSVDKLLEFGGMKR